MERIADIKAASNQFNEQVSIKEFNNPDFGLTRVVLIDDEPWWILKDICKVLNLTSPHKVFERLDEDEKGRTSIPTRGGKQEMAIVNESGLYNVVLRSDKPNAKPFQKWVTKDVLPSVRKYGAYMTPETIEKAILTPDYIIQLATRLKESQEENKALTETVFAQNQQIDAQAQQIEELEPKGRYYDLILQTENTITTTQIAKDYGFSAQLFNRILHELEIVFPQNGTWILYQKHANQGYAKTNTYRYWNGDGENSVLSLVWTQKGRLFLYEELKKKGILPCIETNFSQDNERNPIVIRCRTLSHEGNSSYKGIDHDVLAKAYEKYKGNQMPVKEISSRLGVSVTTFYKKIRKYEKFPELLIY